MQLLSLEVGAYLLWAKISLRKQALAEIRRQWENIHPVSGTAPNQSHLNKAIKLGQCIVSVAERLPLKYTCLVQSVALIAMLRRRGISADLRIGVKHNRKAGMSEIAAHSWVEYDSTVVLDSADHGSFVPFDNSRH